MSDMNFLPRRADPPWGHWFVVATFFYLVGPVFMGIATVFRELALGAKLASQLEIFQLLLKSILDAYKQQAPPNFIATAMPFWAACSTWGLAKAATAQKSNEWTPLSWKIATAILASISYGIGWAFASFFGDAPSHTFGATLKTAAMEMMPAGAVLGAIFGGATAKAVVNLPN